MPDISEIQHVVEKIVALRAQADNSYKEIDALENAIRHTTNTTVKTTLESEKQRILQEQDNAYAMCREHTAQVLEWVWKHPDRKNLLQVETKDECSGTRADSGAYWNARYVHFTGVLGDLLQQLQCDELSFSYTYLNKEEVKGLNLSNTASYSHFKKIVNTYFWLELTPLLV